MAREKYPSEAADRFQIRLPAGLRDRIKEAAEANNRSMNSEIVARLEASFQSSRALHSDIANLIEAAVQREVHARLDVILQNLSETAQVLTEAPL